MLVRKERKIHNRHALPGLYSKGGLGAREKEARVAGVAAAATTISLQQHIDTLSTLLASCMCSWMSSDCILSTTRADAGAVNHL
jgi:hypothetical protein